MNVFRAWRVVCSVVIAASLMLSMGQVLAVDGALVRSASGQGAQRMVTKAPVKVDVSPALRSMAVSPAVDLDRQKAVPLGRLPKLGVEAVDGAQPAAAFRPDGALQNAPVTGAMPAPSITFDGVSNIYGVAPPDTNGDISPKYYVQWVNLALQIWEIDRASGAAASVFGPVPGNALWRGFGGPCDTSNDGDPIVLYDELADRWFISQFAISGANYQCIAVSQTDDPTGAWYRYAYDWGQKMNDYPKFGVWPDGYYMTVNQFDANGWAGAGVAVFERSKMLLGSPALMIGYDLSNVNSYFGGILPADLDGAPPPAGTPAYFAEVDDASAPDGGDELRMWEFKTNWSDPLSSTFGQAASFGQPNQILPVINFNPLCSKSGNCIPQRGTGQKLDAIADRLMYRLAYRYFPGYETMVVNHTVDAGSGSPRAGVRWYEIRRTNGVYSIAQQGTFAGANPGSDTTNRWMGSAAMDWQGNIALGYSLSSENMTPSIGYTGRLSGDTSSELTQAERIFFVGPASQEEVNRWGDYSSMSVDPADGCTFWYTNEYSRGGWDWATRVVSFKMPTCTPQPLGSVAGVVKDQDGRPIKGALLSAGSYSQVTDAAGRYAFPRLTPGSYALTASAVGYGEKSASAVSVQAGAQTALDFTLDAHPAAKVTVSVVDGSGKSDWPLYASVTVSTDGKPDEVFFTAPATGSVDLTLFQNVDYTLTVGAADYNTEQRRVSYSAAAASEVFSLTIHPVTGCPDGYAAGPLFNEGFEGAKFPPGGWSKYQLGDANNGFELSSYGASGQYGVYHNDVNVDKMTFDLLVMPAVTVQPDTFLSFNSYSHYAAYTYYHGIFYTTGADPNPSVSTYTELAPLPHPHEQEWEKEVLDLSALVGQTVRLAFVYQGDWADEWYLDDISAYRCSPVSGGRVMGYVTDANTGQPLIGAEVTGAYGAAATIATPGDPNLGDGFYQSFVPLDQPYLTAASPRYKDSSAAVAVDPQAVITQNFALQAALLSPVAKEVSVTLRPSDSPTSRVVTLKNTGGDALDFWAMEANVSSLPSLANMPTGPFAPAHRHLGPDNKDKPNLDGMRYYLGPVPGPMSPERTAAFWKPALANPWGIGYNTDAGNLWISNPQMGGVSQGDDRDYQFTPEGFYTGNTIGTAPWRAAFAADMSYNPNTKKLWQVNVGGNNCIYELDPVTRSATGKTICPPFSVSQRGLAYDPLTDTFYSGSWTDGVINHFNTKGQLLDSADVGLDIAGLAFNPVTRHLFVSTERSTSTDIFVLDAFNHYAVVDAFNISGVIAGAKQGLDIDCLGRLWLVSAPNVFVTQPVEAGVCSWTIPWLTVTPSGSIAANSAQDLTLTFDAKGMSTGTYTGFVILNDTTPYQKQAVKVTLTVPKAKVFLSQVGRSH